MVSKENKMMNRNNELELYVRDILGKISLSNDSSHFANFKDCLPEISVLKYIKE